MRDILAAADDRAVLLITHRPEGLDLVDEVVELSPVRLTGRDQSAGTSPPPSCASRSPEAEEGRVRRDQAGGERLALPERRRPLEQARRHEREDLADVAEVGERVHPHQQQVVALREHVLVHLLRALGRDEQVEPELAALARDPDGVLGRDRGQRILGPRRADVVRLVDRRSGPACAPRAGARARRAPPPTPAPAPPVSGASRDRSRGNARRPAPARPAPTGARRRPRCPSGGGRGCARDRSAARPPRRALELRRTARGQIASPASVSAASSAYSSRSAMGSRRSAAA